MKLTRLERIGHQLTGWRFFKYPDAGPVPPRPWDGEGDQLQTDPPAIRTPKSADIIRHMKASGRLSIHLGSTKPRSDGAVDGYVLNVAKPTDRYYVIRETPTVGGIWWNNGKDSFAKPEDMGIRVPYGEHMVIQGEPMIGYSDRKMHIYDPRTGLITEIQHFEMMTNNCIRVHGLAQYPLDMRSWDVRGRSAARLGLAGGALRYDELKQGFLKRSTMGTPMAHATDYVWPALGTDAPKLSVHPDAVRMGQILRLTPNGYDALLDKGLAPIPRAVVESWYQKGIIVVDTSGNHSFGCEPDNRFVAAEMAPLKEVTLDYFEIWQL